MPKIEPYRVLFPLGLAFGLAGALLWVAFSLWALYDLGNVSTYPSAPHADLMAGGFLFCFAAGFLMTALPRFFGTIQARLWEQGLMSSLVLGMGAVSLRESRLAFHALSGASYLLLIFFYLSRLRLRTFKKPIEMTYVELGLALAFGGVLLLLGRDLLFLDENWGALGRKLQSQGLILSLILGLGSRLLPAILGWKEPIPLKPGVTARTKEGSWAILTSSTLALSFPLEIWGPLPWGLVLRAAAITLVALRVWRLQRPGINTVRLSYWTRVSGLALVLGLWLQALVPGRAVHMLHFTLIAGAALMVFMIAAMVTVSHGGHDMAVARDSAFLWGTGVFSLLAALTRAVAPFTPSYVWHLFGAAALWITALGLWSWYFLPLLVRVRKPEGP